MIGKELVPAGVGLPGLSLVAGGEKKDPGEGQGAIAGVAY